MEKTIANNYSQAEKGASGRPLISSIADFVRTHVLRLPTIYLWTPAESLSFYPSSDQVQLTMTPHPSLRVNGLPAVSEDHDTSSPTAEQAATRENRKMAMLQRMRPPPFTHAWDFYHDAHSTLEAYENRLTLITGNIVNIKMFWENQNNFPFENLKMKDSVHLFTRGVKPAWEDRRNVKGGCWTFRVRKELSAEFWQEICMMAIGEQIQGVLEEGRVDLSFLTLSCQMLIRLL